MFFETTITQSKAVKVKTLFIVFTMNETSYSKLASIEGTYGPPDYPTNNSNWDASTYPGMRRAVEPFPVSLPGDMVLIRTGGNALQAVSRELVRELTRDRMIVSVPENCNSGNTLLVRSPDGQRIISAVIPEGALPGHTFLIQLPKEEEVQQPMAVVGIPLEGDLLNIALQQQQENSAGGTKVAAGHDIESTDLCLEESLPEPRSLQQQQRSQVELTHPPSYAGATAGYNNDMRSAANTQNTRSSNDDSNLVLIKVPIGAAPGTKIRVRVPDGRTIDATVPAGNLSEVYLRLPNKKQNWHDNPLAVAPMTLGPMFL
jgi:hypothetical protein